MKKFDYSINPQTGIHRSPLWRIAGYSLNDTATILYMSMMAFISYYMIGFLGVATIFASTFVAILRIWDGVTDPIIGLLLDKTNGRFGKNRPFMIIGNIILCAASYLLFHVTHLLPEWLKLPFFIIIALIYYIGYTFQCIVTKSAQTCVTNDPKQRPRFGMFLGIFNTLSGIAFIVYISNILMPKYGTMYDIGLFHEMWLYVVILAGILTIIATISIAPKDNSNYYGTGKPQHIGLKDYWDVIKHNRAIQMLIVSASTDKLAQAAKTSAATVVMYGIVVGNYATSGGFAMYTALAGIIFGIIGLGIFAPRVGLRKAMLVGSWGGIIINGLLCLLWLLGDPKTLNLPGFVNGYGQAFAGITFFTGALFSLTLTGVLFSALAGNTVYPMTADCADYEIYRSGRYVPGLVGTLFSFVDKIVSSFAPVIAGLLFALIGFSKELPDISTPETPALRYVGIFLSYGMLIIGFLCNVIAMKFYPLTKEKMVEIQTHIIEIKKEYQNEIRTEGHTS
ncbi:MAG: MFS transporter [Treponema sp.]|jgi:Na+/melibiose symporter-like transporter|nr:MFS transporter [Treponema sp.]